MLSAITKIRRTVSKDVVSKISETISQSSSFTKASLILRSLSQQKLSMTDANGSSQTSEDRSSNSKKNYRRQLFGLKIIIQIIINYHTNFDIFFKMKLFRN